MELEGEEAVEFGAEGFGERNGVEVDPGSAEGEPESLVAVVGEGFRTAQAERQGARGTEAIEHGNELVEFGGDQRALLDCAEVVGAGAVVAHFQHFGHHRMRGEFQLHAVAVVPGRGGVDGDFFFPVEFAQPPQGFAQDVHFQLQLVVVAQVLVVAAAAAGEVGAVGLDAVGGGLHHLGRQGADELARLFDGDDFHLLAGEHEGNEDRFAVVMGEPVAAIDQLFNFDVEIVHGTQPPAGSAVGGPGDEAAPSTGR